MCRYARRSVLLKLNNSQEGLRAAADLRWGRGYVSPDSLVAPPQTQKLADRSDVISEVPKCCKIKIFRGSAQDPAMELTALPRTPI